MPVVGLTRDGTREIDLGPLKSFAIEKLPRKNALREVLLRERERIELSTFLARLPIWLQLSRLEQGDSR